MRRRRSREVRRWVALAMLAVLVGSAVTWFVTRQPLPRAVRIATGLPGGRYHAFGERLAAAYERRTGRAVEVIATDGSVENRRRLLTADPLRRVDLAIFQAGSVPIDGLAMIAPLFPDVMHVVARADRGIEQVDDLRGRRVAVGVPLSGMKVSAGHLMAHYGIGPDDLEIVAVGLDEFEVDSTIDAAVLTTNANNARLARLLAGGFFVLIPIPDASAIAARYHCYDVRTIPRGLFSERPKVPREPVETISTTAYLAVREGAPDPFVEEVLEALYAEIGPWDMPDLIGRDAAASYRLARLHPMARSFFDPFDQLGWTATVLESLSALKELLVAIAAGIYLLWDRWRRLREKEAQEEYRVQKDRLDLYLEQTAEIERSQLGDRRPGRPPRPARPGRPDQARRPGPLHPRGPPRRRHLRAVPPPVQQPDEPDPVEGRHQHDADPRLTAGRSPGWAGADRAYFGRSTGHAPCSALAVPMSIR